MSDRKLVVQVAGYADSDARERAELAWGLQEQLRKLDVEDVSPPTGDAPGGAKGSAFDWAQLVVTLAGSLPPVVTAVRAWLGHHAGVSIALEIDGDRIELSDASPSERRALFDAWMTRHGG
jgi:membrane-associated two-gene conflict system component 1 (EACC1)